jgi:Uma2 family endonuclease
MSTKTLLTAAELEQMPDVDSVRTELDEGELITMPPASFEHGGYEAEIIVILHDYVKRHKLGNVYGSSAGYRLTDDTVREPDVSFVRSARLTSLKSKNKGFANGSPDLAVEIISPSDSIRQLMRKVKQYFAAGTHTVWIVYPDEQEVQVLEATGTDRWLKGDDPIEAPELLPGFSVPISQFFE